MVEEWHLRRLPSNARERLIRTGTGVLCMLLISQSYGQVDALALEMRAKAMVPEPWRSRKEPEEARLK